MIESFIGLIMCVVPLVLIFGIGTATTIFAIYYIFTKGGGNGDKNSNIKISDQKEIK